MTTKLTVKGKSLASEKEADGTVNKRTCYQKCNGLIVYTSFTFEMTLLYFSEFYSLSNLYFCLIFNESCLIQFIQFNLTLFQTHRSISV